MKILRSLFLFCFLFAVDFSVAQNPLVKQWDRDFGGTLYDVLHCVQQTSDGGFVLGGYSPSGAGGDKTQPSWGGYDYWIVKTDSLGIKQWDKRFGGTGDEVLNCLQQTSDGGYILGGTSSSGVGGDKTQPSWGLEDYWIVKIDSSGNYQWDKRFGGTNQDGLLSVKQTFDGGYILGGGSSSGISGDKTQPAWSVVGDYWIVKIDGSGNYQWDKRFGGIANDELFSLHQTSDSGYILGGSSGSGISGDKTQPSWGYFDYWIVKTDVSGNYEWDQRFGGIDPDQLNCLQETSDGGYILGGWSYSGISGDKTQPSWGDADYWIVKTDSFGIKEWDQRFGGSGADEEFPFGSVAETYDNGYLIAGTSNSSISGDKTENNLGTEQVWVVKTDALGIKKWDKTIFTTGEDMDGYAIQTTDSCYAIATFTSADIGGYKTEQSWSNTADYWIVKFCDTTAVPPLSISSSDQLICEKFCVTFSDQSINTPTAWQWIFPGGTPASSYDQNPTNICYNNPGSFDVTLITTNANGNDTLILPDYITVYPTPLLPSISQTGYTLTSTAALYYQWQFNSVNIPGATNQTYLVLQSGVYTIVITDDNGCTSSSSLNVLITGINEVSANNHVSIYPNPSNGYFIVELFNCQIDNELKIEVRNMIGQVVFSEEEKISYADSKTEIDLRRDAMHCVSTMHCVSAGVYLIEISERNPSDNKQDILTRKKIIIVQ